MRCSPMEVSRDLTSLADGFNPSDPSLDPVLAQESVQRRATDLQLLGYPAKVALVDCEDMHDEVRLEPLPRFFKGHGRRGLFLVEQGKI